MAMPASIASLGEWKWTCSPCRWISPPSGRYRPVRMFESVLLPAPFSPSSACTSPAAASKSTPSFAITPGNRFVIPRIATAGEAPGSPAPLVAGSEVGACCPTSLARWRNVRHRAYDSLNEPLHRVQGADARLRPWVPTRAFRDPDLAALVLDRPAELVELAGLHLPFPRGDQCLRLRTHLWPVGRQLGEAVLDRAVVEAGLPRPVHRRLHAAQVVQAPVVDRRGQPLLRRELARVGVVADPRDALLLGDDAGRGAVDVLPEHVDAGRDQVVRGGRLLRRREPRRRPDQPHLCPGMRRLRSECERIRVPD